MGSTDLAVEFLKLLLCQQVGALVFLCGCAQNAFSRQWRWRWVVIGLILMLWGANLVPQAVNVE